VRLLEAIEAEQFEKLPGGVFRRSFVLQYATALGIDPDDIADELKQLNQFDDAEVMPTPEQLRGVEPPAASGSPFRGDLPGLSGSTLGSLIAAVGVMLACALFYSWWQRPRQVVPATRTEIPAAKPEPPAALPPAVSTPAATPAPEEPKTEAATATPVAIENAPIRVNVSVVGEKTWISISSDGKNIFSNSLEPNETKMIEASEKVRLLIGNAGGVEISLNGKPIGPVGSKGQIRVVELTQAGFQIAPPKPPTPAL